MIFNLRKGLLDRLDPRTKCIAVILLSVQTLAGGVPGVSLTAVELLFVLIIHPWYVIPCIAQSRKVFWFLFFIVGINSITADGDVLVEFAGLYATREGLLEGGFQSSRIYLLFLNSLLFVRTTTIPAIIDALESFLSPVRHSLGYVIQVVSISLNFGPRLVRAAREIKKSQLARGFVHEPRWNSQVRFALSAALPLFANALRTSEHLSLAMESRGYHPLHARTRYGVLTLQGGDLVVLAVLPITALAVLWIA